MNEITTGQQPTANSVTSYLQMPGHIVNRFLGRFGFQLVRKSVPPASQFRSDPIERSNVDSILCEFAKLMEPGSQLADVQSWHQYLSESRIRFFWEIINLLEQLNISPTGKHVLDFGSGTGYLLRLVDQTAAPLKLYGVDSFPAFNQLAGMLCPSANFEVDLALIDSKFDLIFCTEVLEHLVDPKSQIRQLHERLSADGQMVLTVPNGRTDTHEPLEMREDGSGYWGHIHFWSPESWALFLQDAIGDNCEIVTGLTQTGYNYAIISSG